MPMPFHRVVVLFGLITRPEAIEHRTVHRPIELARSGRGSVLAARVAVKREFRPSTLSLDRRDHAAAAVRLPDARQPVLDLLCRSFCACWRLVDRKCERIASRSSSRCLSLDSLDGVAQLQQLARCRADVVAERLHAAYERAVVDRELVMYL